MYPAGESGSRLITRSKRCRASVPGRTCKEQCAKPVNFASFFVPQIFPPNILLFPLYQCDIKRRDYFIRDFILYGENIFQYAVEAAGPGVNSCFRVYQLGGNPDAVSGLAHTPLHDVTHAQFTAYLTQIHMPAFVLKRGVSAHHAEPGQL